ncbi:MAG TPA: non-ribosomal peptide synthetase [Thermoanaerobaculia bacterium]|nr:non-ribosomal peptide synthetase [Thermoanaerobaculia bacterium]
MSMVNSYRTLSDLLHAQAGGSRSVHYITGEKSTTAVSYADLLSRALVLLGRLQKAGMVAGDQMILFLDDNEQFIDSFWAAVLGGIIPVPIAVGLSDEHRHKLFRIHSRLERPHLFTDSRNVERLAAFATAEGLESDLATIRSTTVLADDDGDARRGIEHVAAPGDIAFIQFSSGSTNEPKGVVLTHRNLLTNINAIIEWTKFTPDDVSLSWMPLTHDMGLIGFHLSMMAAGMDQYLMPTDLFVRRPLLWLKAASDVGATILASPNFGYKHFLKAFQPSKLTGVDLRRVRMIVNGAEPISAALCNDFLDAMEPYGLRRSAMFPVYGLAEASLGATFTPIGSGLRSLSVDRTTLGVGDAVKLVDSDARGSASFVYVGFPILDFEVRLTDDEGRELGERSVGHVLIRGGNVKPGYYRDDETNRATIDGEGWLDTGDLGFRLDGELVITGRAKEIIFVSGQNYYPHDLEAIAEKHAGAEMGKVVAAGARGPRSQSEEVILFVLHRGGLEELVEEGRRLAGIVGEHAGVEVAHVIPIRRVPKTTSGKVQRNLLARQYEDGEFDEVLAEIEKVAGPVEKSQAAQSTIEQALLAIFAEIEPDKKIGVAENLFETGLSSLKLVEIHTRIDDTWPDAIDITEMFDYPTIAELAQCIEQKASSAQTPA